MIPSIRAGLTAVACLVVASGSVATGGAQTDKYALVVGIDDYPGTEEDLEGSVTDSRRFAQLLITKFGFKRENVVVLNNADATRDRIINAFVKHLGQAGPQGTAVFYYSGHGVQMNENLALTPPVDPEADGRDEALVVWGSGTRTGVILDDEIGYLVDQLKTERVLLVHDSCNSGTSARGVSRDIRPREVKFARLQPSLLMPRTFMVGDARTPDAQRSALGVLETRGSHALLAGAKDDELSNAVTGLPGQRGFAGAFTYYLVVALESVDERTTFAQLMDKVRAQTSSYILTHFREQQTPQVSGPLASRTVMSVLR